MSNSSDFAEMTLPDISGDDGLFVDGDWIESKDQDPNGDVRLIQMMDVGDGEFINKSQRYLMADTATRLRCTFLEPGDVLISRMPDPLGRACIFPGDPRPCVTAVDVCIVRPSLNKADARWLMYAVNSPRFRSQINRWTTGTTRARISRGNLGQIPLSVPPLSEQRRIADILDKADAIRRKRQEADQQCNDFLTSAFITLFGDPVLNPRKWPETTLDEVAHLQSGVTKGRNFGDQQTIDVPYMRVWNVQDGHLRLDDIKDITVLPSDVEKYSLEEGDLLLTEGGDPDQLGRGAIWYAPIPVCIHQNHIFRVRCDQKVIIPEFLSALIGSQKGKRYFLKMAKQTTGIASINMTQLKKCPVFLPPLHLQQQFAKLDRQFEKTCGTFKQRFDEVDQLFGSLVQRAFRGDL